MTEKIIVDTESHKEIPNEPKSVLLRSKKGRDLKDAFTDKPAPQEPVVEEKFEPIVVVPEKSEKPSEEDLSWEDKGEKIGDEIKIEKENETEPVPLVERRKYERDFLLQFQFMQMCTEKPAGLPDIEVVLDYPAPASKSGGGSQRSDFLPSFARQKSQGGGGGRRGSRGKQPRKITDAAPPSPVVPKQSENRWLQPEEKEKELFEEEKKTANPYNLDVIAAYMSNATSMYYTPVQANQPIQQQQQQQQPTQSPNAAVQTNNTNKPKPKRTECSLLHKLQPE